MKEGRGKEGTNRNQGSSERGEMKSSWKTSLRRWHLRWALKEARESRGWHSRWRPHRGQRHRGVKTWCVLATGREGQLGWSTHCLKESCGEPGWKDQAGPEYSIIVVVVLTAFSEKHHLLDARHFARCGRCKITSHTVLPWCSYSPVRRNATHTATSTKCTGATCKVCTSI